MTTTTTRTHPLLRRWPTAAGIALAAGMAVGMAGHAEVAPVVAASGFVYLGAAALGRRDAAWPVFGVSFVLIALGNVVAGFDPTWWMVGVGAALVAYGAVRGALRPTWGMPLQTGAMVVLGAIAVTAAATGAAWAGLLVAAALLAHAGWDVHHHRTERVVSRSMAEFCAVLDTLLALAVLVVTVA
ncbi:hypothetical protein ACFQV2_27525 [Actinokineospora soli]|uniref:Uncharacterized protein n=1 Tax=Actinokineospora soli TaxID=1048753 RepID=A0ABW2TT27_9PSEU